MEPVSRKIEARFRGPTSSEDFNQWIEDNYFDLVQLFNASRKNKSSIEENLSFLLKENLFMQRKIEKLEGLIEAMQESIASSKGILSKSFYSIENITTNNCKIDTQYGIAHLDLDQIPISKVYLRDSFGKVFVPNSLNVSLYESYSPIGNIRGKIELPIQEDKSIINAFNGSKDSYWIRNHYTSEAINEVYAIIDIDLPRNIINHTRVNTIYLDPAPEFSFSILDVLYSSSGTWERLDTFPKMTDGETPQEISDAGKLAFIFPHKDILKLRLYIKQNKWIPEGNNRVFSYGFKSIEVFFTRFKEESSSFTVRFDIPDPSRSFSKILSISTLPSKGGIKTNSGIKTRLFLENGSTKNINETLPSTTKTVYVEVSLFPVEGVTPTISQLNIEYETTSS